MPDAMSRDPEVDIEDAMARALRNRFAGNDDFQQAAEEVIAALHAAGYRVVAAESDAEERTVRLSVIEGAIGVLAMVAAQHAIGPTNRELAAKVRDDLLRAAAPTEEERQHE